MTDVSDIKRFSTSTTVDGNFVGEHDGAVYRVIENNVDRFREILRFAHTLPHFIRSTIHQDLQDTLIIEHDKLDYITYHHEWTLRQKVEAATAVVALQERLAQRGYFLDDPHAFNVTFSGGQPVYFDLGSIHEGTVSASLWFLRHFSTRRVGDYWSDVLRMSQVARLRIYLKMRVTNEPYRVLRGDLERLRAPRSVRQVFLRKPAAETCWTRYVQSDPTLDLDLPRNANFAQILDDHRPKSVLDIGANKGSYSVFSVERSADTAICLDLDEVSLDYLRGEAREKGLAVTTAKVDLMDYDETPGCFGTYLPAHDRLGADFCICLAVVHHVCYFGGASFEEFAARLDRFARRVIVVEFVPYDDEHLSGPAYKAQDRSWYTFDRFLAAMRVYFPGPVRVFESSPQPRKLVTFEKTIVR